MSNEINQITEPLTVIIRNMILLHGGGIIASMLFVTALHIVLETVFNKKSNLTLLILSFIVGIIYRGYTIDWIHSITFISSLGVFVVGLGYGLLAFMGYFVVVIPATKIIVSILDKKFGIKISIKDIIQKHIRPKRRR